MLNTSQFDFCGERVCPSSVWRAHTMDRSGNPAGTEANTWKVLPRVASWMEFAELRFIS